MRCANGWMRLNPFEIRASVQHIPKARLMYIELGLNPFEIRASVQLTRLLARFIVCRLNPFEIRASVQHAWAADAEFQMRSQSL